MKSLIALAVIAAAAIAADQPELAIGTAFDAPDDVADKLVADGLAKLADAPAAKPAKAVRVRLLVANEHGQPNDVRDLPAKVAEVLVKAGDADDDKAAVAFAAALPQNQKKQDKARSVFALRLPARPAGGCKPKPEPPPT